MDESTARTVLDLYGQDTEEAMDRCQDKEKQSEKSDPEMDFELFKTELKKFVSLEVDRQITSRIGVALDLDSEAIVGILEGKGIAVDDDHIAGNAKVTE